MKKLLLCMLLCSITIVGENSHHSNSKYFIDDTDDYSYDPSEQLCYIGRLYFSQKKFDDAIPYLQEAKSLGSVDAIIFLGLIYCTQNNISAAEQELNEAIQKDSPIANWALAIVHNNLDAALSYINKQDLDNYPDLLLKLGYVSQKMNKKALAECYFKMAYENGLEPALYVLGKLYEGQHNFTLAEKTYAKIPKKSENIGFY